MNILFQRIFAVSSGLGQLKYPNGLALSGDDQLYVCDCMNDRVQVFGLDGSHVRSWGSEGGGPGQFYLPTGLVVDEECVYVCDFGNHRVQVFALDGDLIAAFVDNGFYNHVLLSLNLILFNILLNEF